MEPLWKQIAGDLRQLIATLPDGAALPSEPQLMAKHHAARGTVQRAYTDLQQAGLVTGGKPRRVARAHPRVVHLTRTADRTATGEDTANGADSWLADMPDPGVRVKVVTEEAPREVAERLGVPPGSWVIARRNTRLTGGRPGSLATYWFPKDVADGTPLSEPGAYLPGTLGWLERKHGALVHRARVGTRPAAPEEARDLGMTAGFGVLEVWRTSATYGGRVLVVSRLVYPGDQVVLEPAFGGGPVDVPGERCER